MVTIGILIGWKEKVHQSWSSENSVRWFIVFCFISLLCLVGCEFTNSYEIYSNEAIGLQMEIPSDWNIEETERIASLTLTPSRGKNRGSVSIFIALLSFDTGEDLAEALEWQVDRLKDRWSIDEITIIEPVEESIQNDLQIVKMTIEAPVQSQFEERINGPNSFQPMDILILDTGNRRISILFRKNTDNPDLNDEGQNIINSIRAYP